MFSLATAVVALAASVAAMPHVPRTSSKSTSVASSSSVVSASSAPVIGGVSFNNWGDFSSLSGFDDFFGSDNFCAQNNVQTVLSQTVECHSEQIVVIQQQLAILQEFAKRIVTEQICEVEVQTIVWSQFESSFSAFGDDLRHVSGRSIGYDHEVASHISDLVDSSDNIITTDFGFKGLDIGSNLIVPTGSNWDDSTSPIFVQQALLASQSAVLASSSSFTSSSTLGHASSFGGFSGLGGSSGTFEVGAF